MGSRNHRKLGKKDCERRAEEIEALIREGWEGARKCGERVDFGGLGCGLEKEDWGRKAAKGYNERLQRVFGTSFLGLGSARGVNRMFMPYRVSSTRPACS